MITKELRPGVAPFKIAACCVVLGVAIAALETFVWTFPPEYRTAVWLGCLAAATTTVASALVPRASGWLLGAGIAPFMPLFLLMFVGLFWWPAHLLPVGMIGYAAIRAANERSRPVVDPDGTHYVR